MDAVALEDVSKAYGSVVAVRDVSIQIRKGEFYSLLGPSGCGKTTTLRIIAGLERADAGRVFIGGEDVTSLPAHRRTVNTVFQHYALFPHMTVEENVAYGLRQAKVPKDEMAARLEDAVQIVRLTGLRDRKPSQLSGGQQQRVALARALVNRPTALLLDEPLAALDLKLRKALQLELKKLQERVGVTFVYVTHDQEEALTLSDRIAVVNQGRILQEGTPEEIYERPRSQFVADFIGQTNFFEGEILEAGETTVVRDVAGFVIRCAPAQWARAGMRVTVALRPEKIGPANGAAALDANRVTGTLTRRAFMGDLVQYLVLLPGGREITCQRQNDRTDPAAAWRVGEQVDIEWPARAAFVLREEDGAVADEEDLRIVDDEPDAQRTGEGKEEGWTRVPRGA